MAKPLVFILPGIMGSTLYSRYLVGPDRPLWPPYYPSREVLGELQLMPDGRTNIDGRLDGIYANDLWPGLYVKMETWLDGLGWQVYRVPYDWRHDIQVIAGDVYRDMTRVAAGGPFWMVGHSMGGMVGALIVQLEKEAGAAGQIQRLVVVGAPLTGAAETIASFCRVGIFYTWLYTLDYVAASTSGKPAER